MNLTGILTPREAAEWQRTLDKNEQEAFKERGPLLRGWDEYFNSPSVKNGPYIQRAWQIFKDVKIHDKSDQLIPGRVVEALEDLRKQCKRKNLDLGDFYEKDLFSFKDQAIEDGFELCNRRLVAHATTSCMELILRHFQECFPLVVPDPELDAKSLIFELGLHPERIAKFEELDLELDLLNDDEGIELLPDGFTNLPFPSLKAIKLDASTTSSIKLFVLPPSDKFFPTSPITHFSAANQALRTFDPQIGAKAWKVTTLDLSGNKLTSLPPLSSNWPMEKANFSRNRIERVHGDFGKGWNQCTELDLGGNPVCKEWGKINIIEANLPPTCKILI